MHKPPTHPHYFDVDFARTPYVVAWETTRACALACRHCRASALPRRDAAELSTAEGRQLMDDLVLMGKPILILTGGDPFMRPDLLELASYGVSQGLRVAFSPSATALATSERLRQLRDAGISMVQISLDGLEATHDAFRGVPGSFKRTLEIMRETRALGLPLQIGTTVTKQTRPDLPAVAALLAEADIQVWNVFFLVPTGRGQKADMLGAHDTESVLNWLWEQSRAAGFRVRTTAAQQYRRVVIQHERQVRGLPPDQAESEVQWESTGAGYAFREGRAPRQQGVNDGNGFAFVSHTGAVCPSGFLQETAGNLRQASIITLYRDHPLFRRLRDPGQLQGKCGQCDYRSVCGGSRARAWALTGNDMASDPACAYQP